MARKAQRPLPSLTSASDDPLKRDFRLFLFVIWEHLGLPKPTPIQLAIAFYLQHGPKRSIISGFRGVAKSWITSAYVVWLLYCNPQLNILVVSASKARADDFSTFTLRLINEVPILQHLIPTEDQRCSKIAFDVAPARASHAPSVKSAGITGQITGSRADVIIGDDVEVPNNSATQALRDQLSSYVKEFESILKPLETARIIFLGTPQTEQTVYNMLVAERGYEMRIWPARYPGPKQRRAYGDRLAPDIARQLDANPGLGSTYGDRGAPTDPQRFSHEDLLEREASIGRSTFALQFMLDTSLSDTEKYPLRLADMIVLDLNPDKAPVDMTWGSDPALQVRDVPNVGFNSDRIHKPFFLNDKAFEPYHGVVMAIDPAGRGMDEVGYAIVGYLYGRLYLLDAGGLRGGYEDRNLEFLATKAKAYKVTKIISEPNFGDGMFNKLLKPVLARIYPCTLEESERSTSQKESRIIDTLEPVLNQHRLVVDKALFQRDYDSVEAYPLEAQPYYRLFYQLTRITRSKGSLRKDDRVDALALAVYYWTEQMDRDERKAAQSHADRMRDKAVEEFMRRYHKVNGRPGGPSLGRRESKGWGRRGR
jgi:hypothetical protein